MIARQMPADACVPDMPPEPYRIKMVERIVPTTREQRTRALEAARWNLFRLPAPLVLVDLLTDSGTSAMSDTQWGAMLTGDEAYAGGSSFARFEASVRDLFGFPHVMPTHQGRAAERLLFELLLKPGDAVVNNSHFDTTRANIEQLGGVAVDCVTDCAYAPAKGCPFKGQIDLGKMRAAFASQRVVLGMVTLTNNSGGGQPVSMRNIREVGRELRRRGVPFIVDACRFAENAWFIREREMPDRPVLEIVREMFSYADGCTMSAKKDGLANIGGFFACRDGALADRFRERMIVTEGFPTYGGLAGRDLDAIAIGLREAVDEEYLRHRVGQVAWLAGRLDEAGVPVVKPAGGHAVFIDAGAFLPHLPPAEFPGQALSCELYLEGGVRTCEIGSLMFPGGGARLDLVRLAIPRRVYTASHLEYVAQCVIRVFRGRDAVRGLRLVKEPPVLRHFLAELAPIA